MLWEQCIPLSLKAMRTLVIRPLQGYGNMAPLSYPDTWVRKPDCLHLPYNVLRPRLGWVLLKDGLYLSYSSVLKQTLTQKSISAGWSPWARKQLFTDDSNAGQMDHTVISDGNVPPAATQHLPSKENGRTRSEVD